MSSKENHKNSVFSFACLNVSEGDVNYIHRNNLQSVAEGECELSEPYTVTLRLVCFYHPMAFNCISLNGYARHKLFVMITNSDLFDEPI